MQLGGCAAAAQAGFGRSAQGLASPDYKLEIAPYLLEASPRHRFQTLAYNGQVPGPLLRLHEGKEVTVEVVNRSSEAEIVHWHGLFLPSEIDGASEEGTPMIAPGATARYTFTPQPAGFRWYHTHVPANGDFHKAQYGGLHGFLLIEPRDQSSTHDATYDQEIFLNLHDWGGRLAGGDDGSMNPVYEVATINGRMLGYGEPLRVKSAQRVLLHILNSSPTEVHWLALAGHRFAVVALDGNPVPTRTVDMLRLAPAERVSALVDLQAPGVWVLGEVRKHIQAAGMGIVVEYAGAGGKPVWVQPSALAWNYADFDAPAATPPDAAAATRIDLALNAKFEGHGSEERYTINGQSYPHTEEPVLRPGRRYRLVIRNLSGDDHPMHLHRHSFQIKTLATGEQLGGLLKDVVLVPAHGTVEVEFTAANPGRSLFHCHQQDHMDRGLMMVFRYA
jgi:FtsP/CotA-like multicopper oxidase with cupredoxin domain